MATIKKAKTKKARGVHLKRIFLSTKTILASQAKKAKDTKKNNRYCLLNSKDSKETGKKKRGNKNTNK